MHKIKTPKRINTLQRERLIAEIGNFKRASKWYNSNALVAILSATIIGFSLFLTFRLDSDAKKDRLDQKEKEIIKRERELDIKITEFQLNKLNEKRDSLSMFIIELTDSLNYLHSGISGLSIQRDNLYRINSELSQKTQEIKEQLEYAPIESEIQQIKSISKGEDYPLIEYIPNNIRDNQKFAPKIINDIKNKLLKSDDYRVVCVGMYFLAKGTNDIKWKTDLRDSIFYFAKDLIKKDSLIDKRVLQFLHSDIWTLQEKENILKELILLLKLETAHQKNIYRCFYEAMTIYYYDTTLVKLNPKLFFEYVDINLTKLSIDNFNREYDYIYTLFYLSPQTFTALFIKHFYSIASYMSTLSSPINKSIVMSKELTIDGLIISQMIPYLNYKNTRSILNNFSLSAYVENFERIEDRSFDYSNVVKYLESDKSIIERWLGISRSIFIENPELLYNVIKNDSI